MKRSKTLLVANILVSCYTAFLLIWFVIINGDELKHIARGLRILGSDAEFIIILLWIHIILFVIGCIFGWISYGRAKKATTQAVLCLIASILFPIYFFILIPIVVLCFVGSSNQKKLLMQNQFRAQ